MGAGCLTCRRALKNILHWHHRRRKTLCCVVAGVVPCSVTMATYSASEHFGWIARAAPAFRVDGDKVEVLRDPSQFYERLKFEIGVDTTTIVQTEIRRARRRVVLASLYLGTGKLEEELVVCLHEACQRAAREPANELEVQILLDYNRGTRGATSSCTMLLPLVQQFSDNVQVALYHSPDLRGFLKWILPERFNETVSLSHLKVYLFDDVLIMSGANLSESYFTNRQDRYIVLRDCPQLADFFSRLVSVMSSMSFLLNADSTMTLPEDLQHHPFNDNDGGAMYKEEAIRRLAPLLDPDSYPQSNASLDNPSESSSADTPSTDTIVFPLVQMGPFGISVDDTVTRRLLETSPAGSEICLASGYFNLTGHYIAAILDASKSSYNIVTASPEANGFFQGHGVSGGIPAAYTLIARNFWHEVCTRCQQQRIQLHEFSRPGWTFHGKGLWYYMPGHTLPSLTFIGSQNFGYRSVFRDLEAQVAIVTTNIRLQQDLHEEKQSLFDRSTQVTTETFTQPERAVPLWVSIVTKIIRTYF